MLTFWKFPKNHSNRISSARNNVVVCMLKAISRMLHEHLSLIIDSLAVPIDSVRTYIFRTIRWNVNLSALTSKVRVTYSTWNFVLHFKYYIGLALKFGDCLWKSFVRLPIVFRYIVFNLYSMVISIHLIKFVQLFMLSPVAQSCSILYATVEHRRTLLDARHNSQHIRTRKI